MYNFWDRKPLYVSISTWRNKLNMPMVSVVPQDIEATCTSLCRISEFDQYYEAWRKSSETKWSGKLNHLYKIQNQLFKSQFFVQQLPCTPIINKICMLLDNAIMWLSNGILRPMGSKLAYFWRKRHARVPAPGYDRRNAQICLALEQRLHSALMSELTSRPAFLLVHQHSWHVQPFCGVPSVLEKPAFKKLTNQSSNNDENQNAAVRDWFLHN